jgi:hypothetical protein
MVVFLYLKMFCSMKRDILILFYFLNQLKTPISKHPMYLYPHYPLAHNLHNLTITTSTNPTTSIIEHTHTPTPTTSSNIQSHNEIHTNNTCYSLTSNPCPVAPNITLSDPSISTRPTNTHPMQTRAKLGIVLPRQNPKLLLTHTETKTARQKLC